MSKEHGFLFNADMVRAIKAGNKVQTRRPVTARNSQVGSGRLPARFDALDLMGTLHSGRTKAGPFILAWFTSEEHEGVAPVTPRIEVGDVLWVRETWAIARLLTDFETQVVDDVIVYEGPASAHAHNRDLVVYAADCSDIEAHPDDRLIRRYRPSIHMPRWASRFNLRVTRVRAERAWDISEADIASEGVDVALAVTVTERDRSDFPDSYSAWAAVWDAIYGDWARNPWVWVYDFDVEER